MIDNDMLYYLITVEKKQLCLVFCGRTASKQVIDWDLAQIIFPSFLNAFLTDFIALLLWGGEESNL